MKKFNNITDNNPFKVPDNYFDEVNRKIISATSGYNGKMKRIGFYSRFKPYLLIAASVTGFILLSYATFEWFSHERITSQLSELITSDKTESYLNDIDISSLEENAASIDLNEEPGANKSDIIDYLLLENIDLNDIYEQL